MAAVAVTGLKEKLFSLQKENGAAARIGPAEIRPPRALARLHLRQPRRRRGAARAEPGEARALLAGLSGGRDGGGAALADGETAALELEGARRELHRRLPPGV